MSLNNIKLNDHLLAALYSTMLIDAPASSILKEPSINFLGNNVKHILVVANNDMATPLTGNELTFLTNILGACKLSIEDVAIINKINLSTTAYTDILRLLESKIILLFGVDPLTFGLPLNFPYFQVQQFNNCTYLYAPPLMEIEQDKPLKSKLWGNLKGLLCL